MAKCAKLTEENQMETNQIVLETDLDSEKLGIRYIWRMLMLWISRLMHVVNNISVVADRTMNLANYEHKKLCYDYITDEPPEPPKKNESKASKE